MIKSVNTLFIVYLDITNYQQMIPEFLNKFRTELEKHKRETIKINAIPLSENESTAITESKFLGKPYLPKNTDYPKDQHGKPMILWAQINFNEFSRFENYPVSGILQFYASTDNWYETNDYKILFHDDLTQESQNDFSFLTENLYEESPIYKEHRLNFSKHIEYGSSEDHRFSIQFEGNDFWEFRETLSPEEQEKIDKIIDGSGHRIGGYAYFTQGDPREYNNKKEDILLLQIDTDEEIMFGDSGVANLFIHPKDLDNKQFDKAWFYWDCC